MLKDKNIVITGSGRGIGRGVYCPYCSSKMPESSNLKFCVVCGKDIEKYLNF